MEKQVTSTKVPQKSGIIIKTLYFYIVSLVGLLMIIIPGVNIINVVLKNYVFNIDESAYYYTGQTEADKQIARLNQDNQVKRDLTQDVSILIVGVPLFAVNWRLIKKNKMSE